MFFVFVDNGSNTLKTSDAVEMFFSEDEASDYCTLHPYTFYLHEKEIDCFNEKNHYSMESIESLIADENIPF